MVNRLLQHPITDKQLSMYSACCTLLFYFYSKINSRNNNHHGNYGYSYMYGLRKSI